MMYNSCWCTSSPTSSAGQGLLKSRFTVNACAFVWFYRFLFTVCYDVSAPRGPTPLPSHNWPCGLWYRFSVWSHVYFGSTARTCASRQPGAGAVPHPGHSRQQCSDSKTDTSGVNKGNHQACSHLLLGELWPWSAWWGGATRHTPRRPFGGHPAEDRWAIPSTPVAKRTSSRHAVAKAPRRVPWGAALTTISLHGRKYCCGWLCHRAAAAGENPT